MKNNFCPDCGCQMELDNDEDVYWCNVCGYNEVVQKTYYHPSEIGNMDKRIRIMVAKAIWR